MDKSVSQTGPHEPENTDQETDKIEEGSHVTELYYFNTNPVTTSGSTPPTGDESVKDCYSANVEKFQFVKVNNVNSQIKSEEAEETINALKAKIKELTEDNKAYKCINDNLQEELLCMNEAVEEFSNLQISIRQITTRANSLEHKKAELQRSIEILQAEKEHLLAEKIKSTTELQNQIDILRTENSSLMKTVQVYEKDNFKAKIRQLTGLLNSKQDLLEEKENEIRSLKLKQRAPARKENTKNEATTERKSIVLKEHKKLQATVQTVHIFNQTDNIEVDHKLVQVEDPQLAALKEELETTKAELTYLKETLVNCENIKKDLSDKLEQTKQKLDDTEDKFSEAVEKICNMRTEIAATDKIIDKKNDIIEEMRKALDEADDELNQTHFEIKELSEELIKLRDRHLKLSEEMDGSCDIKNQLEQALVEMSKLTTKIFSAEYLQKRLQTELQDVYLTAEDAKKQAETFKGALEDVGVRIINMESLQISLQNQITNSDLTINLVCAEMNNFSTCLGDMSDTVNLFKSQTFINKFDGNFTNTLSLVEPRNMRNEIDRSTKKKCISELHKHINEMSVQLANKEIEREQLENRAQAAEARLKSCFMEIETLNMAMSEERESDKSVNMSESLEKLQDEIVQSRRHIKFLHKQLKEANAEIIQLKEKKKGKSHNRGNQTENQMPTKETATFSTGTCTEYKEPMDIAFEAKLETELLKREIEFRETIQKEYQAKLQNAEAKYKTVPSSASKQQEEQIAYLLEQQRTNKIYLASMLEEWSNNVFDLEQKNQQLIKELNLAKTECEKLKVMMQGREEELVDLAKMMEKEALETVELWKKFTVGIVKKFCDGFCNITNVQNGLLKGLEEFEEEIAIIENQFYVNISKAKGDS